MEQKLLLQDLANLLAEKEGISKRQAETFVRAFFDITEEALLQDNYVKITGFGTAKLVEVSERESVNIHTGERFQIQGHSKVSFTPDANLRDLVNRPFAHFTTVTLNDETTEEELAEADKLVIESAPQPQEVEEEEETIVATTEETLLPSEEPQPEAENPFADEEVETPQEVQPIAVVAEVETTTEEATEEPKEEAMEINIEPAIETEEEGSQQEKENTIFISLPSETDEHEAEEAAEEEVVAEEAPIEFEQALEIEEEVDEEEKNFTISTATADIQQTKGDDVTNIKGSILVKTEENNQRSKTNYWKIGFLIVTAILLLQIGYCAGQKELFASLTHENAKPAVAKEQAKEVEAQPTQTTQSETPAPSTSEKETTTPAAAPPKADVKTEVKSESLQVATPKSATPKPTPKPAPTPKKVDYKKAAEQYQQLPKGSMLIVGTASQYEFAVGDNIYRLARKMYGNKDLAPYIILHNNLDNPDNIPVGKVIKLPKLVEKSAVEAAQ